MTPDLLFVTLPANHEKARLGRANFAGWAGGIQLSWAEIQGV